MKRHHSVIHLEVLLANIHGSVYATGH